MNKIEQNLKQYLILAIKQAFDYDIASEDVVVEMPKDANHGDYATSVAMRLTKELKQNPRMIAETMLEHFDIEKAGVASYELAGPGFINFKMKMEVLATIIDDIKQQGESFGINDSGKKHKINVEYVSANPTGNLHLGHARGAAWGDAVTRLLRASGYDVCREYYINDLGAQINNLGLSLRARYHELFGVSVELPEDGYYGQDVKDIAKMIADKDGNKYLNDFSDETLEWYKNEGKYYELERIKADLAYFRCEFDVWTSEKSLYDSGDVINTFESLKEKGLTYEEDGAVWLKTSLYGDDKDRVLEKKDGSYTYFLPDIAYHMNKFARGFETCVNFWGGDHHGYIPRMKAAMEAVGYTKDALEVDVIQMVRLVENGQEVKMSKRSGDAVTIRDLCDDIGVDATRYFFVQRALDSHLDFDLGLARSKSSDNPVYYAQYAYARMSSIISAATGFEEANTYELLGHDKEVQLLKQLNEFISVVADCAKDRAPHKLCNYIQKLAKNFHSFYDACKVNDPSNPVLSAQRLSLLMAMKITLKNALNFIGVDAIEKM